MKQLIVSAILLLFFFSPLTINAQELPKVKNKAFLGVGIQDAQPLTVPPYLVVPEVKDPNKPFPGITYITEVYANSPAEAAGIKKGDVLIALDGELIYGINHFVERLSRYRPGDRPKIIFLRTHPHVTKDSQFPIIQYGEVFPILGATDEKYQSERSKTFAPPAPQIIDDLIID